MRKLYSSYSVISKKNASWIYYNIMHIHINTYYEAFKHGEKSVIKEQFLCGKKINCQRYHIKLFHLTSILCVRYKIKTLVIGAACVSCWKVNIIVPLGASNRKSKGIIILVPFTTVNWANDDQSTSFRRKINHTIWLSLPIIVNHYVYNVYC